MCPPPTEIKDINGIILKINDEIKLKKKRLSR